MLDPSRRPVAPPGIRLSRAALLMLLGLAVVAAAAYAAATVTDFDVVPTGPSVRLFWSTSSEGNNQGFYIWRSEAAPIGYQRLPLGNPILVQSKAAATGAELPENQAMQATLDYEFTDVQVTPGTTYYYMIEDVPADGTTGTATDPVSVLFSPLPTPVSPLATPGTSPLATPEATSTPIPSVAFYAVPPAVMAGECSMVGWEVTGAQAVFLDGAGVNLTGSKEFCPCKRETHMLTVQYLNGMWEEFQVPISVIGECLAESPLPTASATPEALKTLYIPTPTPNRVLLSPLTDATRSPMAVEPEASVLGTPTPDVIAYAAPLISRDATQAICAPAARLSRLIPVEGSVGVSQARWWPFLLGWGIGGALITTGGVASWKRPE